MRNVFSLLVSILVRTLACIGFALVIRQPITALTVTAFVLISASLTVALRIYSQTLRDKEKEKEKRKR